MRKNVEKEIEQLEQEPPFLISNDQPKALEILKVIKGNIFLLKNIEFDMLKQLDRELLEEMNKRDGDRNDTGCGGCTWNSFDNYSESFDNSCSGDTGCIGGDSGCGGSGCGGCGGCS